MRKTYTLLYNPIRFYIILLLKLLIFISQIGIMYIPKQ
nr:MAG TPA: hypothetical protein [Caudoviricetes sp.]